MMMEQNILRVIAIDSTHGIGPKLKLATLMTVNSNYEGIALALYLLIRKHRNDGIIF
jgi:hypothetical protein